MVAAQITMYSIKKYGKPENAQLRIINFFFLLSQFFSDKKSFQSCIFGISGALLISSILSFILWPSFNVKSLQFNDVLTNTVDNRRMKSTTMKLLGIFPSDSHYSQSFQHSFEEQKKESMLNFQELNPYNSEIPFSLIIMIYSKHIIKQMTMI